VPDLVHTIKELKKNWRSIAQILGTEKTEPSAEHVAE
jgi:hypothetical protein